MTVLDQPWQIELAQLQVLRAALRLEIKGLKHSRGSVYALVKRRFGFKGSKQRVLEQFEALIKEKERAAGIVDSGR